MPTVQARAIKRGAEIFGEEELARRLGVTIERLQFWMRGAALPPESVFLAMVDLLGEHLLEQIKNRGPTREAP